MSNLERRDFIKKTVLAGFGATLLNDAAPGAAAADNAEPKYINKSGKAKKIEGRPIVPMFHPAAALHQPALRDAIIADFEALPALIAAIAPERRAPPPEPPEQLRLF